MGQGEGMTLVLLKIPHGLCSGNSMKKQTKKGEEKAGKQEESPKYLHYHCNLIIETTVAISD